MVSSKLAHPWLLRLNNFLTGKFFIIECSSFVKNLYSLHTPCKFCLDIMICASDFKMAQPIIVISLTSSCLYSPGIFSMMWWYNWLLSMLYEYVLCSNGHWCDQTDWSFFSWSWSQSIVSIIILISIDISINRLTWLQFQLKPWTQDYICLQSSLLIGSIILWSIVLIWCNQVSRLSMFWFDNFHHVQSCLIACLLVLLQSNFSIISCCEHCHNELINHLLAWALTQSIVGVLPMQCSSQLD